jgi:hypothetical protein
VQLCQGSGWNKWSSTLILTSQSDENIQAKEETTSAGSYIAQEASLELTLSNFKSMVGDQLSSVSSHSKSDDEIKADHSHELEDGKDFITEPTYAFSTNGSYLHKGHMWNFFGCGNVDDRSEKSQSRFDSRMRTSISNSITGAYSKGIFISQTALVTQIS